MENKKELRVLIQQLKDGGFTVTNSDGWYNALDDDDTEVMVALPHSNGSYMVILNNDYFDESGRH